MPTNKMGITPKNTVSKSGSTTARNAEFAQDMTALDDTAMIADILTTQKTLIKTYGTALCEGSNEKFRHICNTHLTEIAEDQFDSFRYMHERNLYPTDPAPAPKLSEAKQRYKATETKMKK